MLTSTGHRPTGSDRGHALPPALLAAGRGRRYERGSLLFAEGDEAHDVIAIVAGSVKVVVTASDGRQVLIEVFDAGGLLGELAVLDGERRTATAIALTPVEVVTLPRGDFRRLVEDDHEVALAIISLLTARLRATATRHVELGAADAVSRVCWRLLELGRRYGRADVAGRVVIKAPLTQLDVAEWAGLSREAVVKALRQLRSAGWVDICGRQIVLTDQPALLARASESGHGTRPLRSRPMAGSDPLR